jgi:hypothetical protein
VGKIEDLCRQYEGFASSHWPDHLAGAQRIWFAVYDRMDERRLRARLGIFEEATGRARHQWRLCDLTDESNNYRMLDARDGWNYLAVPITASERT